MRERASILLVLVACSSGARVPTPPTASRDGGAPAQPIVAALPGDAGGAADASFAPLAPLAWGTRPAGGPLYPVLDGECLDGRVHPLDDGSALYAYGDYEGGITTLARFTDSGIEMRPELMRMKDGSAFTFTPWSVEGPSPDVILAESADREGTRARSYTTVWGYRPDTGWFSISSHRDSDGAEMSNVLLFKGNALFLRHTNLMGGFENYRYGTVTAVPIAKDATKLSNVAPLTGPHNVKPRFVVSDEEIYLTATMEQDNAHDDYLFMRAWRDGKVRNVALPKPRKTFEIVASRPRLIAKINDHEVRRLGANDVWEPVTEDVDALAFGGKLAPDGSRWLVERSGTGKITRRDPSGKVEELGLPQGKQRVDGWRPRFVSGVEQGDIYALNDDGDLFHYVDGAFTSVPLPAPPFAGDGSYRVTAVVVAAKGDLFVSAVVGPIGKTPPKRQAILRTKPPTEVLRCNEGAGGSGHKNGRGFMSWPPRATAECTTPFVVLQRTAYETSSPKPIVKVDAKSDFPTLRDALKSIAGLPERVALVELAAGDQRYVGLRVPSADVGAAVVTAVTKKMKVPFDHPPEIVCGEPQTIVRTLGVP